MFYQSGKVILEDNYDMMGYLLNNIKLCEKLAKIKDNDFSKFSTESQKIIGNFKKLKKIKKYSTFLSKREQNLFSDINIFGEYIKSIFMIDFIAYQNITKILEENKEHLYLIYDLVAEVDFAISIAYYRASIGEYVNPEFTNENIMELEDVYHPLLDEPIKNSININIHLLKLLL